MSFRALLTSRRASPKRAACAAFLPVLAALASAPAAAGPYDLDSPNIVKYREFKIGGTNLSERNASTKIGKLLATVPVRSDLEFEAVATYHWVNPKRGASYEGLGDLKISSKYAIFQNDADTWVPRIAVAPKLTLPLGQRRGGLGTGDVKAELPFFFGKTFGAVGAFGKVGYSHDFGPGGDTIPFVALLTVTPAKGFTMGVDVSGNTYRDRMGAVQLIADVGFVWKLTPYMELQGVLGRSVVSRPGEGPITRQRLILEFIF